jgi:(S)-ureidoglycine aminohydrolase
MNELFGFTRDVIKERYALRTPSGFVPSRLPGWTRATGIVQISEGMGARFCQLLVTLEPGGEGRGNTGPLEFMMYVLTGDCRVELGGKSHNLSAGGFVYVPPEHEFCLTDAKGGARVLIFQKRFESLAGARQPGIIIGNERDVAGQPFLGNKDARLQVLLPDQPEFDLAVNIFTYQPGATLPFVESHIMEHGLVMLQGQGIYRLDSDWHPVQAGDVIWMAPYCPQWFVAMGASPARYIYYKDVNRSPLG